MPPPPFHLTENPTADWLIIGVSALFCLYWINALRLAREGARLFFSNVVKAGAVFVLLVVALGLSRPRTHLLSSQEAIIAGVVALICFVRFQSRKRSRNIPQATRRAVIARDLKGERFDPRRHQIDHVWPFSRGGSHTRDNLRVIAKKKNLRKGAKRPRMRDMF